MIKPSTIKLLVTILLLGGFMVSPLLLEALIPVTIHPSSTFEIEVRQIVIDELKHYDLIPPNEEIDALP